MEITKTVTIAKDPQDVYGFWRQLDRLPTFMAHLDQVRVTGATTTHWVARAPLDRAVEWDAEITHDEPGRTLTWRSLPGSDVTNEGTVSFLPAPGDRGTELTVTLRYDMPAGKAGDAVARLFGEEPRQQLDDDLRRLKQVLETGEVVRSDGAPGGKRAMKQRPARPMDADELAQVLS